MRLARELALVLAVAVVPLGCALGPAAAERVWIETAEGERGHGWLFGSGGGTPGECWIATALHVVEDPYTRSPTPFVFVDQHGVSGESETPIAVPDAIAGPGDSSGLRDLAFARVAFGRERGKCLSRLGVNRLAYETALRSSPELTVYDLLPTSFGTFTARVGGGGLGDADGRLILAPIDPDARVHLKRGLSGAVAEATIAGVPEPFAMVQDVDPGQDRMLTLRFDRVRHAFEQMTEAMSGRPEVPKRVMPYDLVSLEGTTIEGSPTSLSGEDGPMSCWRSTASADVPSIRLVISIPAGDTALQWLHLVQSAACNADGAAVTLDAGVDDEAAWSKLSDCRLDDAGYRCRANLKGPRFLRINVFSRGEVGFSGLALE